MNLPTEVDVLVAGGGIAGTAIAAALSEFGYEVLVVEPGMDGSKRLAGELIHLARFDAMRYVNGKTIYETNFLGYVFAPLIIIDQRNRSYMSLSITDVGF